MMKGTNEASSYTAEMIPINSIGVELGVWKADSSRKFLPKCKHLYLVDAWSIQPYKDSDGDEWESYEKYLKRYAQITGGETEEDFTVFYDKLYESICKEFEDKPVTILRTTTEQFFKEFHDEVDWIYLDASHEYNQVKKDLYNCMKILKSDGKLFGDDFHPSKPAVMQAVNEFVKETGLTFRNFHHNQYLIKR